MTLQHAIDKMPAGALFSVGIKGGAAYIFIGNKTEFTAVSALLNEKLRSKLKEGEYIPIEQRTIVEHYSRFADRSRIAMLIEKTGKGYGVGDGRYWNRDDFLKDKNMAEAIARYRSSAEGAA